MYVDNRLLRHFVQRQSRLSRLSLSLILSSLHSLSHSPTSLSFSLSLALSFSHSVCCVCNKCVLECCCCCCCCRRGRCLLRYDSCTGSRSQVSCRSCRCFSVAAASQLEVVAVWVSVFVCLLCVCKSQLCLCVAIVVAAVCGEVVTKKNCASDGFERDVAKARENRKLVEIKTSTRMKRK